MISPTAQHTIETVSHALGIAGQLVDDATWLHTEAYFPRGRDRDRPTWAFALDPTNPDAVPGEQWDLGTATDAVRRRYAQAGALVANAARIAGDAILRANGTTPVPAGSVKAALGPDFARKVRDTTNRLATLKHYGIERLGPDALALTWSAASHLIEAHGQLRRAMPNPLRKPDPPADRRCKNCREPHTEPDRTSAVECAACRMYRRRHNGEARPYRRNAAALQAKDRRLQRGEDHATEDGGIQAGTYRGNEWVPRSAVS